MIASVQSIQVIKETMQLEKFNYVITDADGAPLDCCSNVNNPFDNMFDPDRAGGIFTSFFLPIRSPSRLGASIYQIPLCEEEGVGQGKVPYNVQ